MSFDPTKSVFKVTGSESEKFGTGFIIYKDEEYTYFLTCEHVIEDVGGSSNLQVGGSEAELMYSDPAKGFDFAVLKVKKVFQAPPLQLSLNTLNDGTELMGCGFYDVGEQIGLESFNCVIEKEFQITSANKRERAWWIKTLIGDKLHSGFSGSPICDSKGIVYAYVNQKKRKGDEGVAISIDALKHLWEIPFLDKRDSQGISNRLNKNDSSLINFKSEIKIFDELLKGENGYKLIALEGKGGRGKSRLIREFMKMIKERDLIMRVIDLKSDIEIESLFDWIIDDLGESNFTKYQEYSFEKRPTVLTKTTEKEWHKNLSRKFFSDLNKVQLQSEYFLIFDHFDHSDRSFEEWITNHFLEKITPDSSLNIVIGGQRIPKISFEAKHRIQFDLTTIPLEDYQKYIKENNIDLEFDQLKLIHRACDGSPSLFVQFIKQHLNA